MAKFSSSYGNVLLFVLVLLSNISFQLATCGSIVKFLPGFQGPLPFVLETGYVGVGEKDDVQTFYYFIESENNPKEDPLMLWLTGGPGCSALSGLVFEIGPLEFIKEEYNGSLPNLILKPHSWTKVSNIIFVDLPVFTGFTYATTESGSKRSDTILVHQVHQFLRKWLVDHPKFQSNEVYIGGDSYSGITVPAIVQEIAQGNEKGVQPWINLQGYLLGNAVTTEKETNYKIPFAHGMGLISDELYESLQKNCNGDYVNVETRNVLCSRDMSSFSEATSGLNSAHILDPLCEWLDDTEISPRRSLIKKYPSKFVTKSLKLPPLSCRSYPYFLCGFWANDDNVRKALHIHKGSIGKWHRCTYNIPNKADIHNTYDYHVNLSRKEIRSLIYSGDHDLSVPFLSTQAWIRSLNYSIVDDWRQWHTKDQVAGYTRTYSNKMTFATVKGGGHTAPEFRPQECFDMFSRYVGVGENEDVQVFYYFIESENNPKEDPLMLWLTGGPGCSALSGLVFEIGPLEFKKEEYNGSLPNLILRQHSWTKVSSIIFLDLPVSTGFTYARTNSASQRSDSILVKQALEFLRKWLVDHPKFQSNEVYIGGDSYSGIPVPVIVQEIAQANEKGVQPWINLQGYLLGNAATIENETNYIIPFAHGMGLISDELYDSLQKHCNGDYVNVHIKNVLCSKDINSFNKAISGINKNHILEPLCEWLYNEISPKRSLIQKYNSRVSPLSCRNYPYLLSGYWANDDNVRKALHIRKGSIGKWERCSYDIPHTRDIPNSYDYHVNLSTKGYRSLIYSGDHDLQITFLGTQAWIRSLNNSIVDDWRQWHTNEQVAGYTRTYSNGMTFATVKGAGHTAPEYLPEECFAMFSRWLSKRPL